MDKEMSISRDLALSPSKGANFLFLISTYGIIFQAF